MEQYIDIINSVIMLIVSIIGVLIAKKYINGKDFSEFLQWVKIFVKAAEKLFPDSGQGVQKKDYVTKSLKTMGYEISQETDAAIEAAVLEVDPK